MGYNSNVVRKQKASGLGAFSFGSQSKDGCIHLYILVDNILSIRALY